MQGDTSNNDMIFGSIVLLVFLVFVFLLGFAINKFKNARFVRAWEPLRPVVGGGKVVEDGGGAATSWLAGTYKGRTVCAEMIPGRNRYSGETGFRYNHFAVALIDAPGKSDWSVNTHPVSRDKALEQRLSEAGVMAILAQIGQAEVTYDTRQRKLTIIQEPGASWIPPREHFEKQLNTLLTLGELNAAVNGAH